MEGVEQMMRGEWCAAIETLRLAAGQKDGWGWGVNCGDIWIAQAAARLVHAAELGTRGGVDAAEVVCGLDAREARLPRSSAPPPPLISPASPTHQPCFFRS